MVTTSAVHAIAGDRAGRRGHDDETNIEVMSRARKGRRGNQCRLTGQRNAKAFQRDDPADSGIPVCPDELRRVDMHARKLRPARKLKRGAVPSFRGEKNEVRARRLSGT